ncbi:MAG TPA: ABC transporter ATP-binding protein [Dehalococcoidia bacterium]|nr:ABC transporter ATP-binding protein [Dehalococcoidia bacterium]
MTSSAAPSTATDAAISVSGLRKSYGANEAVRSVDLSVERGEIFALLGPNGAGKTTTVEILEGHRSRDGGDVSVLGHDPADGERAMRERVGIVLQETGVEPYLSVAETVELHRGYYRAPLPLDDVLDVVGLSAQRDERVRRLSGGQRRRLDVAIGLCGDPELLFLDEPTTGFDPSARRSAWEMVRNLRVRGKTVLLTTHYMDEAQALADRVAILAGGEIVARGTLDQLLAHDEMTTISFALPDGHGELLAGLPDVETADGRATIRAATPTATLHELTRRAAERQIELDELSVTRATLEEIYLSLTAGDGSASSEASDE